MNAVTEIARECRLAAQYIQSATSDEKNIALREIHKHLSEQKGQIIAQNNLDLEVSL